MHIIEKYFQEILHCLTMTNIKCKGKREIDLLAINPKTLDKYHVESSVWTTSPFKRERIERFLSDKFDNPQVKNRTQEIFGSEDYSRVLVLWDVFDLSLVPWAQANFNFKIWFMDNLLNQLMKKRVWKGWRDDVLRTLELVSLMQKKAKRLGKYSKRRLIREALTPEKIEELGKGMLEFKKRIDETRQLEHH